MGWLDVDTSYFCKMMVFFAAMGLVGLDGVRRMASGSLPPDVFARIGSAWLTIAKTDLGALGINVRALLSMPDG